MGKIDTALRSVSLRVKIVRSLVAIVSVTRIDEGVTLCACVSIGHVKLRQIYKTLFEENDRHYIKGKLRSELTILTVEI